MIAVNQIRYYPKNSISPKTKAALFRAIPDTSTDQVAFGLLNAYLHVCGIDLNKSDLRYIKDISDLLYGFEGFMLLHTSLNKPMAAKLYYKMKSALASLIGIRWRVNRADPKTARDERQAISTRYFETMFNSSPLIQNYYNGWYANTYDGKKIFIELYEFYNCYGSKLTDYLVDRINDFTTGTKFHTARQAIKLLKPAISFLCRLFPDRTSLQNMQDPLVVSEFIELLLAYRKAESIRSGNKLHYFYSEWGTLLNGMEKMLLNTAIAGNAAYPPPRPSYKKSKEYDGNLSSADNLLSKIPLSLSDEHAFTALKDNIDLDINYVEQCSRATCLDEIRNYRKTICSARRGRIIHNFSGMKLGEDFNEDDVCSTWLHYNHRIKETNFHKAFNATQLADVVKPLGANALMPFFLILVKHHPVITLQWLLDFKLFDESGKAINFVKSGNTYVAIGWKGRAKGHERQEVVLNKTTTTIFKYIIRLTKLARDHMRSIGDPKWVYMCLSPGRTLYKPGKINNLTSLSANKFTHFPLRTMLQTSANSKITTERAFELCESLSPTSLRKNIGIQVYFKTLSRSAVSRALGHSESSSNLVDTYIPSSILIFVMERWIRLFHNAIIFEAMKDSPYLLEALDFTSADELDHFLQTHKDNFRILPVDEAVLYQAADSPATPSYDRLYIDLNAEKLDVLLCIYNIVTKARQSNISLKPIAHKWFDVAEVMYQAMALNSEGILEKHCSRSVLTLFQNAKPSPQLEIKLEGVLYAA